MNNFGSALNQSMYPVGSVNQTMIAGVGGLQTGLFKGRAKCVAEVKDQKSVVLHGGETFSFDFVGAEDVHQEEIFLKVGKPIVDQCLQGYNGSIFAYG
jgi:hypothetical protein